MRKAYQDELFDLIIPCEAPEYKYIRGGPLRGKPEEHNYGQVAMNYELLSGILADEFGRLGLPGAGQ